MLYLVFAKIALVAFGGGYANLPIIQSELLSRGWCTVEQFADIVAIAQMTPGPVVINTATYVGKTLAGIPGGIIATLGFITPAVLITVAIYCLAKKLSSVIFFFFFSVLNQGLHLNRLIYDFADTVQSWGSIRLVVPAIIILILNIFFVKKIHLTIYFCIIISVIIGTPLMYYWRSLVG